MGRDAGSSALPAAALRYRNLRSWAVLLVSSVLLTGGVLLGVPEEHRPAALAVLWVLLVLAATVETPLLNRASIRSTSYEVDECAVRIGRGLLLRRTVVLATAQLVGVTLVEGPLLRRFGLVVVVFSCAATSERLGPLDREEAHHVRSRALDLLGAGAPRGGDPPPLGDPRASSPGSDRA